MNIDTANKKLSAARYRAQLEHNNRWLEAENQMLAAENEALKAMCTLLKKLKGVPVSESKNISS